MILPPGTTSYTGFRFQLMDDAGLPLTNKLAADMPNIYYTTGSNAAAVQITLSDLSAMTSAYSSGGVKEDSGGMAVYRLDLPNLALASGPLSVRVYGEASGKHVIQLEPLSVENVPANVTQWLGSTAPANTGDAYSVVNNASYGNAKLVRATTPATTLDTSSVAQTGDSYARIGPGGASLNAVPDTAGTTTLLSRVTAARAGYLDNLNVGGAVASHSDVLAINTSASKHMLLVTVGQYEPGETYTVEMRTFAAADGSSVNADTTPTLTATGQVSGSLSSNLSPATNSATGVYRWTYTPGASPTLEQIRFDGSATISSATFTLSAYAQTVDDATVVFNATDQAHLTALYNKAPAGNIADEATVLAAIGSPQQVGTKYAVTLNATDVTGNLPADLQTIKTQAVTCAAPVTFGAFVGAAHAIAVDTSGFVTFNNTAIGTVATLSNLPAIPAGWLTAAGIASGALNGKGDWLLANGYTAPPTTAQIATAVWTDTTAGDFTTPGSPGYALLGANAVETGLSLLQSVRGIVAANFGKLVTSGQNPEVYSNPAGTATRLSVANDTSGNRTAVTLTL